MDRIQLQPNTGTENIVVEWLEWLIAKQAIWAQSLVKSLIFFYKLYFVESI